MTILRFTYSSAPHTTMSVVLIAAMYLSTATVSAQRAGELMIEEAVLFDSGLFDNETTQTRVVSLGSVVAAGSPWIRVHIGDYHLGRASFLTLTSLDGQEQRFDAKSLPEWYHWSAVFNGDEVEITLHVAPGDSGVFVRVDQVRSAPPMPGGVAAAPLTICNDFDDRGASNDPAVARMSRAGGGAGLCTAWLVSNGAVLSAGHCPVIAGDIIEFNVPTSLPNGANVAASPNNQYPINVASVQNENNGKGEDWMVFAVNPNANTGLRAHIAQGYYFMTKAGPAEGTILRVTGYGLDNTGPGPGGSFCSGGSAHALPCATSANCPAGGVCVPPNCCDSNSDGTCENNCSAASQTQQSTTGPLDDLDGTIIEHDVDTMPANSGSPIIWEGTGYTIGIHAQGGCDLFFEGYNNHGTRFNRGPLEAALQNFPGPGTVYAFWHNSGLPANGGVFEPFRTVSAAVAAVPYGGRISLVPGSYPRAAGNTFTAGADGKAMTFTAPVGLVTIGN